MFVCYAAAVVLFLARFLLVNWTRRLHVPVTCGGNALPSL